MLSSLVEKPLLGGSEDRQVLTKEYAASLDTQDPIKHIRDEFLIPSKANLRNTTLKQTG
jgi:kynureninase